MPFRGPPARPPPLLIPDRAPPRPAGCRYHPAAATHAIPRRTLLLHRAAALETDVLLANPGWASFVIWGAGRDGRELFKALSPAARRRVKAFCDIDPAKIGSTYQYYEHHVSRRPYPPPRLSCPAEMDLIVLNPHSRTPATR